MKHHYSDLTPSPFLLAGSGLATGSAKLFGRPHLPAKQVRARAILSFHLPGSRDREVFLPDGSVRIGRDPENGIIVPDGSVSRFHAEIGQDDEGRLYVRDLGSTNGVKINDQKAARAFLHYGDRLQIGCIEALLKEASSPEETSPFIEEPVGGVGGAVPGESELITPAVAEPLDEELTAEFGKTKHGEAPTWKRSLDIGLALFMLLALAPVAALTALWITAVSRGPVLYRQLRIGQSGRRFTIYKFRSMKDGCESDVHEAHVGKLVSNDLPMTKLDATGDDRLIFGGKFIRAACIDELPQLLNVLRSEMSMVGPRPSTPHDVKGKSEDCKKRWSVLPGLTGYWQVNGKNKSTFSEMIAMDNYYVENCTLWHDVKIIAKTIPVPLTQLLECVRENKRGRVSRADVTNSVPTIVISQSHLATGQRESSSWTPSSE